VRCRTLVEHIPAITCFKPQYADEADKISAYVRSLPLHYSPHRPWLDTPPAAI
jgi:hypothetical protein